MDPRASQRGRPDCRDQQAAEACRAGSVDGGWPGRDQVTVWNFKIVDASEKRAFPRTARPDGGKNFTFHDLKVDPIED